MTTNAGTSARLAVDPPAPFVRSSGRSTARINEHLGRRLRQRRRLLGLTQLALADSAGLRFQQIQKYECGASAMSAQRLWQMAERLGVPISYFYQGLAPEALTSVEGPTRAAPTPATDEMAELIRVLAKLGEGPRRQFLALMTAMGDDERLAIG